MSQSRYTLRGASSSRALRRRITRRGVAGSVRRPNRRKLNAIQRVRWAAMNWLAEMEAADTAGFNDKADPNDTSGKQ